MQIGSIFWFLNAHGAVVQKVFVEKPINISGGSGCWYCVKVLYIFISIGFNVSGYV